MTEEVNNTPVRTRYGRVVKKPVLYTPDEEVCDDYTPGDYDSELSDSDCDSIVTSGSDSDSDSDSEMGSFIVDDSDDEEEDEDEVSNELKNMTVK